MQGNEFVDMNRVFDYAGDYLEDLKQIHIFIPEMRYCHIPVGYVCHFKV